jgi:mannose-6-phosphate isomerase-like protein (cupin superfamily)
MRRTIVALTFVAFVSLSIWAQQQPAGGGQNQAAPPLQGGQVTAAELAAIVAKQPKDRTGNQTFLQLAPYNVNMEHRVNMPQNAAVHDKEAELFYIIDGSGTIVTGGKLVNPTRNGDNSTASTVEGGTAKRVAKGDWVLVPEGTPHWFSKIDSELTMMSLHLPRTPAK